MFYGSIVVIKRTGADGSVFPVVNPECLFGRDDGCDIRVQLGTVSKNHSRVVVNENGQVMIVTMLIRKLNTSVTFPVEADLLRPLDACSTYYCVKPRFSFFEGLINCIESQVFSLIFVSLSVVANEAGSWYQSTYWAFVKLESVLIQPSYITSSHLPCFTSACSVRLSHRSPFVGFS